MVRTDLSDLPHPHILTYNCERYPGEILFYIYIPWKKVVHPPSTTFPPLSFDKKFHPLYIDFMLKYFQNQNIFTIVNFN